MSAPTMKRDRVMLTAECKVCGLWVVGRTLHDDNTTERVVRLSTLCRCGRMLARWQRAEGNGWSLAITFNDEGHAVHTPWPKDKP